MTAERPPKAESEIGPLHFGPVWKKGYERPVITYAACGTGPSNTMTNHKPWVTCCECKQTKAFKEAP